MTEEAEVTTEEEETEAKALWRLHGATSFNEAEDFAQVEAVKEAIGRLNWLFQDLVSNVMDDPEINNKPAAINALVDEYTQRLQAVPQDAPKQGIFKQITNWFTREEKDLYALEEKRTGPAMKRERGLDFPARDYAYVPDPQKPRTWLLRLTESPGKITLGQLGKAATSLSTGGTAGAKIVLPPAAVSSVKRRIRQEYRKMGVSEKNIPAIVKIDDAQPRAKNRTGFFVIKDQYNANRWFSVYSNNFRDDDNPPEILSEAGHRAFVKSVDQGIFPMPELWLWHWDHPVGDADWLDFTDEGMAVASGTFRKGYEHVGENLAESKETLAVSHGMPTQYIVRDDEDDSIILFHVTKEISPLPAGAAANKLTGFVVLSKEQDDMPISDEKQNFLIETLGEGLFDELNSAVASAGKEAQEEGRESKEADQEAGATEEKDSAIDEPNFVTAEDVSGALVEIVQPLLKAVNALTERVGEMESSVKELQVTDEQKQAALAADTPQASRNIISDLVATQLTSQAEVKDDSALAVAAPRETAAPNPNSTGLDFIDSLIQNSRGGGG